ncbi:retrotransposon protein, putative, ty1-copia subclass [Tanacetum coccineum]|uniref:Retrotransposon protein, putative, ty1-copia subclass n=1 Tax=Tanacetum coccineum TaxID=301880 RepID=A0ABQ4YVC8_9ASTR
MDYSLMVSFSLLLREYKVEAIRLMNTIQLSCLPKLHTQPIPPAPPANSAAQVLAEWNTVYDVYNQFACLMLESMNHRQFENSSPYDMLQELKSMFEKQARVERFDLIQTFYACKQEERKLVGPYIIKMKGYVEQLERLGFIRNYNMHNIRKKIGELHALLIEYEKGLPKKSTTPQVMAIQAYSSIHTTPQHNGVSERRNHTLLDMVQSMTNLTTLPLSFWDYALESATCILNTVPTKKVDKTPHELWYGKVPNLSYLKAWGCDALVKRDTPDKLQQRSIKCIFIGYPKKTMGYYFYFPPENKIVVARYAEFLEKNLISQEVSGRVIELEEIQDEDTSPSENTSKIPMEVEGFEPPQEEVIAIRRSARTHRAPERLCLNLEVEEHSLGDLNEPTNYKAAMLDLESNKWLDAMNAEMQSMKDNQVWCLVDLPPNGKTVGGK